MMQFSGRFGYSHKKAIQVEEVDSDLRIRLWNLLPDHIWKFKTVSGHSGIAGGAGYIREGKLTSFLLHFWQDKLLKTRDTFPTKWNELYTILKSYFFSCAWYELLDTLELFCSYSSQLIVDGGHFFQLACNSVLERECSAYRFLNGMIVPISNQIELTEIDNAVSVASDSARQHLNTALMLFSDRTGPDFRNSIKESISAVEATANIISGKKKSSLGDVLEVVSTRTKLHPAFRKGLDNIYGYTSDSGGIRHALMDDNKVDAPDARFMLVLCSAFVNYLTDKTIRQ